MRVLYVTLLVAGCGRVGFGPIGADVQGALAFDDLACGSSKAATLSMQNSTAAPIAFTCTSTVGALTVTPSSGTVAPGATVELVATAAAPLQSIPGASVDGDLVIQTDAVGAEPIDLPIHLTTSGGVVVLDQSSLDFGQVQDNGTATRTLTLHNTGNATVMVSAGAFADPAYSITDATTVQLVGGGSGVFDVAFMPQQEEVFTDVLPLLVTGNLCRPAPSAVTITGAAIAGTILLDETTLDFGTATCGGGASTLGLTMTNLAGPTTYAAAITAGAYDVAPTAGSLPAGDTSLAITRQVVGVPTVPGPATGTLHLDFTNPPQGEDVTLRHNIVGPWLEVDQPAFDFGMVPNNASVDVTVQVSNTGNDIANVQIVPVGGASTRTTVSPTAFQIPPATSQPVVFTFTNHDNFAPGAIHPLVIKTITKDFQLGATDQCSTTLTVHTTAEVLDN